MGYVDESLLAANDNRALVSGFFPVGFDACGIHSALCELRERSIFPTGSLEVSQIGIDSEDWENEWRKYYAPIEIGKVVIVPAWQSAPDNGEIPVFIRAWNGVRHRQSRNDVCLRGIDAKAGFFR